MTGNTVRIAQVESHRAGKSGQTEDKQCHGKDRTAPEVQEIGQAGFDPFADHRLGQGAAIFGGMGGLPPPHPAGRGGLYSGIKARLSDSEAP